MWWKNATSRIFTFSLRGSLMTTSETLLWALLQPQSHKRKEEKGCFVFSLCSDAEIQTEVLCCREKNKRLKKERKKGSKKKPCLCAQTGARWEELHSAAAHASLSQRPSLTKDPTYFRRENSAMLPVSFIESSAFLDASSKTCISLYPWVNIVLTKLVVHVHYLWLDPFVTDWLLNPNFFLLVYSFWVTHIKKS